MSTEIIGLSPEKGTTRHTRPVNGRTTPPRGENTLRFGCAAKSGRRRSATKSKKGPVGFCGGPVEQKSGHQRQVRTMRSFAAQEEGPESNSCRDPPVNRGQRGHSIASKVAPHKGPKAQKIKKTAPNTSFSSKMRVSGFASLARKPAGGTGIPRSPVKRSTVVLR